MFIYFLDQVLSIVMKSVGALLLLSGSNVLCRCIMYIRTYVLARFVCDIRAALSILVKAVHRVAVVVWESDKQPGTVFCTCKENSIYYTCMFGR